MFDNVWQALGTVGTAAFAVTLVLGAIKRPEAKRLPLWAWAVLLLAVVTITIGNTGSIQAYLLVVSGVVAAVAVIIGGPQLVAAIRDLRQPQPVSQTRPRARIHRLEQMGLPNWKEGHEAFAGEPGVQPGVLLWVRSTDVSKIGPIACEVQAPDGSISRRHLLRNHVSAGGRHDAAYPNDFSGQPPLVDGDYGVIWRAGNGIVRRDQFRIHDGQLER